MGWIILLMSIIGVTIAASGLIASIFFFHNIASYPQLASSYQGTMQNTTTDGSSTLTLTFTQEGQAISGIMTLGLGLTGSGTFTGTVGTDNSIKFTVTSYDRLTVINLTGSVTSQNALSGTYTGHYTNADQLGIDGTNTNQKGTWEAKPGSSQNPYLSMRGVGISFA